MNREIEFRGYCEKDNEWRYGFYITDGRIHEINTQMRCGSFYASQVSIESIGQYTGLKDVDGDKIFEGDVLINVIDDTHAKDKYIVSFNDKNHSGILGWNLLEINGKEVPAFFYGESPGEDYKIIGKIYENPEHWSNKK